MAQFLEELALDDFMGLLLIKELTDSSWEMMRYSRYMNLVMNRRLGPRLAFQEKRRREAAQGNDTIAKGAREIKREPPTCPETCLTTWLRRSMPSCLGPMPTSSITSTPSRWESCTTNVSTSSLLQRQRDETTFLLKSSDTEEEWANACAGFRTTSFRAGGMLTRCNRSRFKRQAFH